MTLKLDQDSNVCKQQYKTWLSWVLMPKYLKIKFTQIWQVETISKNYYIVTQMSVIFFIAEVLIYDLAFVSLTFKLQTSLQNLRKALDHIVLNFVTLQLH